MFSMEAMFAAQSERRRWEGVVAEWQAAYEQLKSDHDKLLKRNDRSVRAAYGTLCHAMLLERALAAVDADHPLVANSGRNDMVRSAIDAGEKASDSGNGDEFERVRSAANAVPLPKRPNVQDQQKFIAALSKTIQNLAGQIKEMKERIEKLEADKTILTEDLIDYVAQREAMRAEIARYDRANQLVTNADLRKRVSEAGRRAYAISGGDWKAVKDAGLSFFSRPPAQGNGGSDVAGG